jgi:hypothetical protein
MVRCSGYADSAYTIPAFTHVKGKTVTGFITFADELKGPPGYKFIATGKNRHLLDGSVVDIPVSRFGSGDFNGVPSYT